ncbi:MAG: hypothetical protein ABII08_01245 [Candidatus Beckwithbacteria bacterium]|nr:hypothetical protein [Patescibacteria group bacterium]
MGENKPELNIEQAQTEAVAVHSIAEAMEGISGKDKKSEPLTKRLSVASLYLDQLKVEQPEVADLMINQANQWKEIETATDDNELSVLLEASHSIPNIKGGKDFLYSLETEIGNEEEVMEKLNFLFEENKSLGGVFQDKPQLTDLWYKHLYTTLKMAVIVARAKSS